MRIVVLPGIWPPDVGGPATHGPELARFLVGRGHSVQVVTMASAPPTELPCPVTTVDRKRPVPVRYGELTLRATRAARGADVVYASSTYAAAAAASVAARRPLVAKLVSDPAYERARRWGLFDGTLEEFQHAGGGKLTALKHARTQALRRAVTVVVPSRYLAEIAGGWGLATGRLHVVPNPAPPARAATATERSGLVFAGRLTRQKAMHVALDALQYVPATALTIIGDGPDRARLEQHAHEAGLNGRVRFVGSLPREEVLDALAGAEAAVLSSDWENFPHAAVEALAVGTPLVATAVGGVGEVVSDGVNGLLVPPGSPEAFGHALQRLLESPELQTRLSDGARHSVLELDADRIYGRIEELLEAAVRP
jgi:glycosyltransferase involved in cell wall biosynthesis